MSKRETTSFEPRYERPLWTLPAVLEVQARDRGASPFLQWTHEQQPVSYAEVNAESNRMAHGFLKLGMRKGDRIVFFMGNSLAHAYCWFACTKIGIVDAPINANFTGAFLIHQMNLCKARYALVDEALVEEVARVQDELPHLKQVVVVGNAAAARAKLPRFEVLSLDEIRTSRTDNPVIAVAPSDPTTILYTSGTTGPSKGVLLPYGAQHFNAELITAIYRLTEDDIFMSPFPLFHGSGRQNSIYPMMLVGGLCVLYDKFSGTRFLERAKRSRATITMFHGAMVQMIAAAEPSPDDRAHRLRAAICIPMPYTLQDEFQARFNLKELIEVIGMTETALPIIPPAGRKAPKGYAGCLVSDWYDARVADPETDEEVPDGVVGELLVRPRASSIMMLRYENMPNETVAANRNLWFHTGDGVRRNADGWYAFVDQVKDSIRRRGENISSFEVEYQLLTHPSIAECAVIPVRVNEEIKDDEVKACIVPRPGAAIDAAELIAWCETKLPRFAVPRFVEFVDELPKTPTGKTQKMKLRVGALSDKTWDRFGTGTKTIREKVS